MCATSCSRVKELLNFQATSRQNEQVVDIVSMG